MKAERIEKKEPEFEPVTIQITLENQEELDLFVNLFNYSPFCDHLRRHGVTPSLIIDALDCRTNGWDEWKEEFKKDLNIK